MSLMDRRNDDLNAQLQPQLATGDVARQHFCQL